MQGTDAGDLLEEEKSAPSEHKKHEGATVEIKEPKEGGAAGEGKKDHHEHRHGDRPREFDYSVKLPEGATERQKELAKGIEEQRRKKGALIADVRRMKRRLAYKMAEKEATAKMVAQGRKSTKNIGYLRRRKENLEFRISTEAYTLEAEKDLIRKKSKIDEELNEAIQSYRMRRKAEFVEGDITELTKGIEEANKSLEEIEKTLDLLYGELRKINGERRRSTEHRERKKQEQPKPVEVSLADIAIIKGRKNDKKEEKDDSE